MNRSEVLKKVRGEKPKDSFMVIQIDGNVKLVLPHKNGLALLDALANAEKFSNRWDASAGHLVGLEDGYVTSRSLSRQEYEAYKMAALLNCSIDDVRDMRPTP